MEPRATAVPTVWDTHEDKEKGKTRKANADEDQGKDEEDEAAVTRRRLVRLQRSTLASLARTERGLGETEAIAGETAALLHAQTEQIEDIHARVGGARAELHQAGQELRVFMRRQMRDRVVVCMSVVILLCLLATVVVSIIRHKW
ncbi:unnamed protein product [Phytomonas sp. EM1]|nr:unnamed protein product [Phytomonas sp. EM1]|eukprot:CCW63961.1 unnamed protein product [Phytomonas sp. isolate EM1]